MSRALTATLTAALNAPSTGEAVALLLTLVHSTFGTKRLLNDNRDLVSRGNTYTALAFLGEFPADLDGVGSGTLLLDGTDPAFVADIRAAKGTPIDITMEVVRLDAPDTVEASAYFQARVQGVDPDGATIQLDCAHEPVQEEAFPGPSYDPVKTPDLFLDPE